MNLCEFKETDRSSDGFVECKPYMIQFMRRNMRDFIQSYPNIFMSSVILVFCFATARQRFQMNDKSIAQTGIARARWFTQFDLTRVNKSAAKWWASHGHRTRRFFVCARAFVHILRLRCVRIYYTTWRKSLQAKCIETFHRIRSQWHEHTHEHFGTHPPWAHSFQL